MDPFARSSLPPVSHQIIHSPAVYSQNLICASDYQDEHHRSSAVLTPPVEMGEYYLPLNGTQASYHGTQPSFPVVPMAYRPPYHYPSESVGQFQHHRPPSASSQGSQEKTHGEQELLYRQPQNMIREYHSRDIVQPSISCASTASSDNDAHPPEALQSMGMPMSVLEGEVGSQDVRELALPPINSNIGMASLHTAEEPRYTDPEVLSTIQDQYFGDHTAAESGEPNFSTSEHSPPPKPTKGKKPSSTKVSEKRRQQNRAAQRAMRERRKKAAQHQEVHMSSILTENALLRRKVAQLSQQLSHFLLQDTIAPGSHHWSSTTPQVSQPALLSPLGINNPLAHGQSVVPAASTPLPSAMSFSQSQATFPSSRMLGPVSFQPPNQGTTMNYFAPTPYDLEYLPQGPGVMGSESLSDPLTAPNLSRPMTAEENAIDSHTHYGRWNEAGDLVAFRAQSPITDGPGQVPPIPAFSTDCGSIQTASTLASPTQDSLSTL